MRDKLWLVALLLSGCAAAPLTVRTTGGTSVEIANVEEGGNCFPVRGADREHGTICTLRLRSNLEQMLGQKLDSVLPRGGAYHARLELTGAGFATSDTAASQLTQRVAIYHFTLDDSSGKRVVDLRDKLIEPVSLIHGGVNLPRPEAMLDYPELYQPAVLYQLMFDMVDRIGQSIQNSQTAQR